MIWLLVGWIHIKRDCINIFKRRFAMQYWQAINFTFVQTDRHHIMSMRF